MTRRKLLVLDLDETLIHATEERLDRDEDFKLFEYHVYKRPYLDEFLDFAFSNFDVGVWTSSGEHYAQGIVAEVFRAKPPAFLFSSLRCTLRRDFNTGGHVPVKRLSKLKSRGYKLEEIIAVDDTAHKHKDNYGNLVHVAEYNGDQGDEELLLLRHYLAVLANEPNVRSIEKRGWRSRALEIRRAGV
jgi:RNA polymerase II subunit A small phosphatase-like protein